MAALKLLLHHRLAIATVLSFLVIPARNAIACTCAAYPDDPKLAAQLAFAQADAVFIGDVIKVNRQILRRPPAREVLFQVSKSWKGVDLDTTLVWTPVGELACGLKLKKRRRYLIFAYWDQNRQKLTTNFCALTREESEAGDLISELNRIHQSK